MAEDKYLLEDGSGGYQLEDASGVLLIDYPPADATVGMATGRLYPQPVVQYQASAAPMVVGSGMSWMPRLPEPVQRAIVGLSFVVVPLLPAPAAQTWVHPPTPDPVRVVVPSQSVVAAPLTVPAPASVNWIFPIIQDAVRLPSRSDSVLVQPSIATGSLPQNITWWPQFPDRVVQRIRFQEPLTVGPPVSPTLPSGADAGVQGAGGQLYPRPVVQYQSIAGPVLVDAAVTPTIPLQFNEDGLIRPDRWTHNVAVAAPVAIPLETGWWPQTVDAAPATRPSFSLYAKPIQPLNPAALSTLPWLMRNEPLILPQYPTRSVLALNPTTPAPVAVVIPWLVPPGQLIFRPVARYEAFYAKPLQPQDPDGRSDLPWLVTQPPGQLALRFIRSETIAPVSPPAAVLVHGWWVRQPDLVRLLRENPPARAVPIRPLNPDGRSDLPWLPQAPPGIARPIAAPGSLAFIVAGLFQSLAPVHQATATPIGSQPYDVESIIVTYTTETDQLTYTVERIP